MSKDANIGVIIQSRMTSNRFPGKAIALLEGTPVIEHVLRNCSLIRPINKIIVAVPDTPESEPILKIAKKLNIDNFCGSEEDVLGRYYNTANFFKLDIIIRVCGDSPYVNPKVASEVVQLLIFRKLDYCSNCYPVRTYPKGLDVEAFTMEALEAAHLSTLARPPEAEHEALATHLADREHVTPWMQRTAGLRRANIQQAIDASHINLCIDEPDDIKRVTKWKLEIKSNT